MRKKSTYSLSKILIALIVVMFLSAFAMKSIAMTTPVVSRDPAPTEKMQTQASPENVPYEAAYSGKYVCLPHKDTRGPQTMECAFGLQLGDGTYIALDMGTFLKSQTLKFKAGNRIRVMGTFVPIEQLSTDMWQKYPITGILQVKEGEKI